MNDKRLTDADLYEIANNSLGQERPPDKPPKFDFDRPYQTSEWLLKWVNFNATCMARELLAARARIAELEAEIARLPVRNVRVKNGAIEGKLFGEGD